MSKHTKIIICLSLYSFQLKMVFFFLLNLINVLFVSICAVTISKSMTWLTSGFKT